jgi:hypothetical protein
MGDFLPVPSVTARHGLAVSGRMALFRPALGNERVGKPRR